MIRGFRRRPQDRLRQATAALRPPIGTTQPSTTGRIVLMGVAKATSGVAVVMSKPPARSGDRSDARLSQSESPAPGQAASARRPGLGASAEDPAPRRPPAVKHDHEGRPAPAGSQRDTGAAERDASHAATPPPEPAGGNSGHRREPASATGTGTDVGDGASPSPVVDSLRADRDRLGGSESEPASQPRGSERGGGRG